MGLLSTLLFSLLVFKCSVVAQFAHWGVFFWRNFYQVILALPCQRDRIFGVQYAKKYAIFIYDANGCCQNLLIRSVERAKRFERNPSFIVYAHCDDEDFCKAIEAS